MFVFLCLTYYFTKSIPVVACGKISSFFMAEYIPLWAAQVALVVKNLPVSAGDTRDEGSIPGSGRSPGGGHGNPLQYSFLENPKDGGAWQATVCSVTKSWTRLKRLSTQAHVCHCRYMYHIYVIHSSNDRQLGCLHISPMVNNAAMNIGVHVPFLISVFTFSGQVSRTGTAGSYGSSIC